MFIQLGAQDYQFTVWHHCLTDTAKHFERMAKHCLTDTAKHFERMAKLFEQSTQVIMNSCDHMSVSTDISTDWYQ